VTITIRYALNQIFLHAFYSVLVGVNYFDILFFQGGKMKFTQGLCAFISFSLTFNLYSKDIQKVVYGSDNRVDIYQSTNPLYKKLANSTAAMISNYNITEDGENIIINGQSLEESDGVCSDALFAKQITAASCSGFLVANQYIVTAGHCIETVGECKNYSWVFDFSNTNEENQKHIISKKEVYKCVELTEHVLDSKNDNDFSLVKLDRPVTNRLPLKFRTKGKISKGAQLVVIGHPSGLPTKISDDANIRSNINKQFFVTNLDTFGGNSGSAVFDAKTGVVEGILVRGEQDYVSDPVLNCIRPKVCGMNECRGEDVTRITNVKKLKKIN
jgi:V8-like Glu-specific endopeptidase